MEQKNFKHSALKLTPVVDNSTTSTNSALIQSSETQPYQITDTLSFSGLSPTDSLGSKHSSESRNSRFKSLQFDSSVSFRKASKLTFSPDTKLSGRGHNRNDTLTSIDLSKVSRPMSYADTRNETDRLNLNTKLIEAEEKRLQWNIKRLEKQQQLEQERKHETEAADYRHKFLTKLREAEHERRLKDREEARKFNEQRHFDRREARQKQAEDCKTRQQDDLDRSLNQVEQNLKYRKEIKQHREAERQEQRATFFENVLTQKEIKAAHDAVLKNDLMSNATLKAENELVLALRKNQEAISRLMTMRTVTSREGNPVPS